MSAIMVLFIKVVCERTNAPTKEKNLTSVTFVVVLSIRIVICERTNAPTQKKNLTSVTFVVEHF